MTDYTACLKWEVHHYRRLLMAEEEVRHDERTQEEDGEQSR
jgi:hypothetical protein